MRSKFPDKNPIISWHSRKLMFICVILLYSAVQTYSAIEVKFNSERIVLQHSGGDNFLNTGDGESGKCGSPGFFDWDNDGKTDLLLGYMRGSGGGYMNIWLNSGTNSEPLYTTGSRSSISVSGA